MPENGITHTIEEIRGYLPEGKVKGDLLLIRLTAPGKSLILYSNPRRSTFATNIANTEEEAKPGTTTRLYTQAFELMVGVTHATRRPWTYEFETEYETMREWALDPAKGMGIFDWDELDETPEHIFIARKTILPANA